MDEKNIVISDANHGGIALIKEYSKFTENSLFFYDTYNKLSSDDKNMLTSKYSISFLTKEEIIENRDKYIIISPVHMTPHFNSDYTHHQFTGYLINKHKEKYNWNFKIIEVTGVKGKTTTATMIKDVLKNNNTLALTSNDLSYNTKNETIVLDDSLSIAPASIITSLNKAKEYDLLDEIDYFICEVSLGITTNADIGILTNIIENYSIANNATKASIAKKSVFDAENIICNKETFDKYYNDIAPENIITVSINNKDASLYAQDIKYDIQETSLKCIYKNREYLLNCFALTDFYVENVLFAFSIGLLLNMDENDLISNIKSMNPIKGRGSVKYVEDKIVFEDINSGLNTTSIKRCISNIKKYSDSYILIIGGDYGITCEEIDENELAAYLNTIDSFILTGDVGHNLNKKITNSKPCFNNIKEAFKYSLNSNYDIIQVIYRSNYNKTCDYM